MKDYLTFTELEPTYLQESFSIIQACAGQLSKLGLDHWSEYYTDFEKYKKYIQEHNSEVFTLSIDEKMVATVMVSSEPPGYYLHPEFGPYAGTGFMHFFTKVDPENSVIYISALGVHPDFQKQGLAKEMLAQIEQLARSRGIKAIRFDTRVEFESAVRLYEGMGYKKVFTDVISEGENYNYYEKLL